MECFVQIVYNFQPLAIFAKCLILDIGEGFEYAYIIYDINFQYLHIEPSEKGTHTNKSMTFFLKY